MSITCSNNKRVLSQILTPANFSKIIRSGDTTPIDNKIKRYLSEYNGGNYQSLISHIYSIIEKEYRSEYVYKNKLLSKLFIRQYVPGKIIALNEFNIANSVADFLLLNGSAHLYEIKTEYDSFDKLDKQIADYKKFADTINIVASPKNSNKLLDKYSGTSIGVIELNKRSLKTVKEGIVDTSHLDHEAIFKTLHKKEYLSIVKYFYDYVPKAPNTLIFKESLSLIKKIDINIFQKTAIEILKQRKLNCPDILKSDAVPEELKYICFALNLSQKEYQALFSFLNNKI
jgi:hypothetical protein